MEKCLIIFDIDETLYINHERRIPNSTLVALDQLKKAGHTLAVATGRAPFEINETIKNQPFDFFILNNGQYVTKNDEVIYENPIDPVTIRELVAEATNEGIQLGFSSAARSTVTGIDEWIHDVFTHSDLTYPEVDASIVEKEPVFQIWFFSDDYPKYEEKYKEKVRFVPWLNRGSDVIPPGASKAAGLQKTIEAYKGELPTKNVFFGDGANDIELVEMADIGVAMGNAVDSLKEKADFITKNIEDDGIYYACEQLGLFDDEK
ncbi:MAG: Cof-type HAD-IIB family hydrolase [Turicibacter sp.]|nr:Cof-type HAD-IIB family hydrolase [Turicibacter sp.]